MWQGIYSSRMCSSIFRTEAWMVFWAALEYPLASRRLKADSYVFLGSFRRFLGASWTALGVSLAPRWAILGRLGDTRPPTWWAKSTNMVQKLMRSGQLFSMLLTTQSTLQSTYSRR